MGAHSDIIKIISGVKEVDPLKYRKPKEYRLVPGRKDGLLRTPTTLIVCSFVVLILTGAVLLSLPVSSRTGSFTPFINALFTATSATCVTGLTVYDTYSHFNLFGQCVILSMIQLGGLGLVTLTSFLYVAVGKKMGLRSAHLAQESVGSDERVDTKQLLKIVIGMTFCTELLGALALIPVFQPEYGRYGIFMAFFFAISAYCNAGFDLLGIVKPGSSLMTAQGNVHLMSVLMILIVVGGLGFIVWQDLFYYRKRKTLMLHTKIVLIFTAVLIFGGALGFLLLEWKNPRTLGHLSFGEKLLNALFQSITCRTAGFDSIGQGNMTGLGKILSVFLMFIGAAPGSTGGGVKVTSFVVLTMTVISVIRSSEETVLFQRRIDKTVVYRAFTVAVLGALLVCLTSCVLILADGANELKAIFEAMSAFSTAGLSAGPTAEAGLLSKCVLILTMLTGRVGPVALIISLSMKEAASSRHKVLPEGRIWVG